MPILFFLIVWFVVAFCSQSIIMFELWINDNWIYETVEKFHWYNYLTTHLFGSLWVAGHFKTYSLLFGITTLIASIRIYKRLEDQL